MRRWLALIWSNDSHNLEDYSGGRWFNLVWLGFVCIPLYTASNPARLATLAALLAFIPLYLWAYYRHGPVLWLSRAAMFAIGAWLFPYNAFAHTLFIYAGIPGARSKPREGVAILLLVMVAANLFVWWRQLDTVYYGLIAIILPGMGFAILIARANRSARLALADKDVEIARLAKLAERERIARDLHDILGHTLSVIVVKSELARKLAQGNERAVAEMTDVASVARNALSEVRQTIAGLHDLRLPDALAASARMLQAAGIETQIEMPPLPPLSVAHEQALAQAVLEAGTNIVRHAQARRATIRATVTEQLLQIDIEDDGRGGAITFGNGLHGMQARLALAGGTLTIASLTPGTRLILGLPYNEQHKVAD